VAQFLAGHLSFGGIAERVADALQELGGSSGDTLDALLAADAAARRHVRSRIVAEL
jgi:1-deoxy-D-xylulose-5-phosphate reductoisomerase